VKTENLQRQHKELLEEAKQISKYLEPRTLSKNAAEVHILLSKMAGKLKIHLEMEDKVLYPALLKYPDEKIQKLTQKYLNEIGNIADTFKKYLAKWPQKMSIQLNPVEFIEETQEIFKVLYQRINKEDNELFPLIKDLEIK